MTVYYWGILLAFSALMFVASPRLRAAGRIDQFFAARDSRGREVGLVLLSASLLISWIFAKSIQNAADLGSRFGAPGGFAYALYWLSIIVAGFAILGLRNQGYASLHGFITSRFGRAAFRLFALILVFRLWNEIWSNTIVVAAYFGPVGSPAYYASAWAATALILAYSLKSGLRSSILTDAVQMGLFAVLLLLILGLVLPANDLRTLATTGSWTLAGGVDLVLVAMLQIWSYPFHDPVMTDRGFITDKKVMLRAFVLAGLAGVALILLFSAVGIHHRVAGLQGNSTAATAAAFGLPMLLMMNLIMLTSAASTLDSTFASAAKLVAIELLPRAGGDRVTVGRIGMVALAAAGGLMVHADPSILSATTVSGTMVMGLAPVFLLSRWRRAGAPSYYASVLVGLGFGTAFALKAIPFAIGTGRYGSLLWANLVGLACCFLAYFLLAWLMPARRAVRD
ncbi:MAG: sodium:solute symporter [Rhodocyclaceae bacterium]